MSNIALGLLTMVVGGALIVFRHWFARVSIEMKNRQFGLHMDEKDIQTNLSLVTIGGVIAVILGLLILIGIIPVR